MWIEDKPETIIGKRKALIKYLRDIKGFDVDIVDADTFEGFEKEVGYDGLKVYDLLLVDLDLGNEIDTNDGNAIITKIRNDKIYTEIIFYSANYDALHTKLQKNPIEGIFTSPRKDIAIKAQAIIDVTLHKVQDVNNLRGLIMAEVAELDRIKENILTKYANHTQDRVIEEYIIEKLKKSYADSTKKVEKYLMSSIEDIIKNLYVDSDKKARAIKKINNKFDEMEYRSNILGTRNKFAHIEECDGYDGQGNSCKLIGDIPFTEKKCIEIRQEIKKYKEILIDIEKEIQ